MTCPIWTGSTAWRALSGRAEGGDADIIAAASYLHDYHRVLEKQSGDRVHSHDAEERVLGTLHASSLPEERAPAVLECIAFTDKHSFADHALGSPTLEAKIVRDADNLDAIGAIGVARAFMYGGRLEEAMWEPTLPPDEIYSPGPAKSVVHHFYEKLLRLKDDMLTPSAQAVARERHAFLELFLQRFLQEWSGQLEACDAQAVDALGRSNNVASA